MFCLGGAGAATWENVSTGILLLLFLKGLLCHIYYYLLIIEIMGFWGFGVLGVFDPDLAAAAPNGEGGLYLV